MGFIEPDKLVWGHDHGLVILRTLVQLPLSRITLCDHTQECRIQVFDRTTIAALEVLGPHTSKLQHWEGTAQFISIVLKFWNIVNVKNTTKGLHKLLEDATVISSIKDDQLNWLDRFSSWLKLWNTKTEKQGQPKLKMRI